MSGRGRPAPKIAPREAPRLVFGKHRICTTCKGKGSKSGYICGTCTGLGVIDTEGDVS